LAWYGIVVVGDGGAENWGAGFAHSHGCGTFESLNRYIHYKICFFSRPQLDYLQDMWASSFQKGKGFSKIIIQISRDS
jgi:hypothetical protein